MSYDFLNDFNRITNNVNKYGVKTGFEKTLQENQNENENYNSFERPKAPQTRKLSEAEIKNPRQAGRKLNPPN